MTQIPRFGRFEQAFEHEGEYAQSYTELAATAHLTEPDGVTVRTIPLFWDGGSTWRFCFSPDKTGGWTWRTESPNAGLDGHRGGFEVVSSEHRGSIRPMSGHPYHFEYQNGERCWFFGDTGWALYTDSEEKQHNRETAERYIDVRAEQGFNVIHSMLLSEAGWGNAGGPAFHDIGAEAINPGYWQEVDERLAYLNHHGIVGGLVLAWGNKGRDEPLAWNRFPNTAARQRYARYITARYSAFDVYFIVAGEWHATIQRTPDATEESVRDAYTALGNAVLDADPHGRMIGIHPMTRHGSVREFVGTSWMAFGDYQQNYHDLHDRILQSRGNKRPIVNSEYGYFLRDQSGDGVPDKSNSTSADAMRHATWDIVMAGGYVVTGFGTTYFGGNRDPGLFDVDTAKNDIWEDQIRIVRRFFTSLEWWKLEPHDEWIECKTSREAKGGKEFAQSVPPATTYWLLADPGRCIVAYVRGLSEPVRIHCQPKPGEHIHAEWLDPRSGEMCEIAQTNSSEPFVYEPPDAQDWVIKLEMLG